MHIDRTRFLIGTYCLADYARTERHIAQLKAAGIDFLCATPAEPELIKLLEKYGIGVMANGIVPGWWGGDGDNAGKLADTISVADYEQAAKGFIDSPAIWGVDLGDEPSALDFPHYGRLFEAAQRLFPNQMPYLNLYPNYASVPDNTADECVSQLGTATYQEHIDAYVRNVPSDYICYDHYMYSVTPRGAYDNLRIVADACRRSGRDMWIVLQVNSNVPDKWMSIGQLMHQAHTALAFGVKSINWACWTAGWWHNEVLDERGEPTRQYERLCAANRAISALTPAYMKYVNVDTRFVGVSPHFEGQQTDAEFGFGPFKRTIAGDAAIIGCMKGANGGTALFIADASDPYCETVDAGSHEICFEISGARAIELTADDTSGVKLSRDGDKYTLTLHTNGAALITTR